MEDVSKSQQLFMFCVINDTSETNLCKVGGLIQLCESGKNSEAPKCKRFAYWVFSHYH